MSETKFNIIPQPAKISMSEGIFQLNSDLVIKTTEDSMKNALMLKQILTKSFGINASIHDLSFKDKNMNEIIFSLKGDLSFINQEGYTIQITKDSINITSLTSIGGFYSIQTLKQLFSAISLGKIDSNSKLKSYKISCCLIEDYPRFKWRGFMLDVGRHFFNKNIIRKIIDIITLLKINRLHLHLTEDQGWRLEIKKYPKLVEVGSIRKGTVTNPRKYLLRSPKKGVSLDGIQVDGYFTQEDMKGIINYAAERHIKIIPEIDMPGHVTAALAAYPELSCTGGPFEVSTRFGIHQEVFCLGNDKVFEFTKDILDEVMNLFPSKIIHTGGDEVPKKRWKKCPKCQNRIRNENLDSIENLQPYFTNQIAKYLASKGRRLMGWNEILNDDLTKNAICQYWTQNLDVVVEHIKKGRNVVMSEFKALYFDYPQSMTSLEKVYNYDPIPIGLEPEFHDQILGLEACLWTEYVKTKEKIEWQTFPRLIAVAESGWTLKENKNFDLFQQRLSKFSKILDTHEINYYKEE